MKRRPRRIVKGVAVVAALAFLLLTSLSNDMGLWPFVPVLVLIACIVLLQVVKEDDKALTTEPRLRTKPGKVVFAALAVPVAVLLALATEGDLLSHNLLTPGAYVFGYLSGRFPSDKWLAWLWAMPITDALFYWCILMFALFAVSRAVKHMRRPVAGTEAPNASVR